MPKLTKSVPKYRKHRASGQAMVTICGKDFYLGPYGTKTSHAEYDRLIAEYLANGRSLASECHVEVSVVEVLAKYWRHAQAYYVKNGKATSELSAMKGVIRPIKRLYGKIPVSEFGPLALKAIREEWIRAGHARGTINRNAQRIVRIFRWAASEELISVSIPQTLATVPGLKKGRTKAHEPAPVPPIDIPTVEATIERLCDIVRDMVRFQLLTGARPGEVCSVRPMDIDRSQDVWEYRPDEHKTEHHERDRIIFIGPAAQAILSTYLLRAADSFCFSPREAVEQQRQAKHAKRSTPLKYGNRPGHRRSGLAGRNAKRHPKERYITDSYRRAIHRACDKAFLPPEPLEGDNLKIWQSEHRWSPNRLRHTRGTEIRKQFGLEAAQVILGHSAANVTEIYAERDAEKAREVARMSG